MAALGIDFGTAAIKAAQATDDGRPPKLLRLCDDQHLLPAAVELSPAGQVVDVGGGPFARRRSALGGVAFAFRDLLISSDSHVLVGGTRCPSQMLLGPLLSAGVQRASQTADAPVDAVALAIPDHWPDGPWAVASHFSELGGDCPLLVREWQSVLAMHDVSQSSEVLLVSAGAGCCRATLCKQQLGQWHRIASQSYPDLSGMKLRGGLLDRLSEQVVRELRRDPREYAEEDQILHDGLEDALRRLLVDDVTQVSLPVFGQRFEQSLTRVELAVAAGIHEAGLARFATDLLRTSGADVVSCPIIVWGELALILPLQDWLAGLVPPHQRVIVAPLDVVAAGTARIAAAFREVETSFLREAAFTTTGGEPASAASNPSPDDKPIALLETLPARPASSVSRTSTSLLLLNSPRSDAMRMALDKSRFVLGRGSDCDWTFASSDFDSVSRRHAEITREGDHYWIVDLGSANGTFVNDGQLRKKTRLQHGDVIALGREGPRLGFEVGDS